jgi:hypothetical protein
LNISDLHILSVGRPYCAGSTWAERAEYNFVANFHELRMFFREPSPAEVYAVQAEPAEFALAVIDGVIFFLYRFGEALPWSECVYTWHMVPKEARAFPQAGDGERERVLLHVVLSDSPRGIVRALRSLTLSPAFTAALNSAIADQAVRTDWTLAEHDRVIDRTRKAYPKVRDLLRLTTVRCFGGD